MRPSIPLQNNRSKTSSTSIPSWKIQAEGRDLYLISNLEHPLWVSLLPWGVIPGLWSPLGCPERIYILGGCYRDLLLANGFVLILGLRLGHVLWVFINYRTRLKRSIYLEINYAPIIKKLSRIPLLLIVVNATIKDHFETAGSQLGAVSGEIACWGSDEDIEG